MLKPTHSLVATLAVAAMTVAAPANAQFTKSGTAYYTTGDYTLSTDISGSEVFVGKTVAFKTVPGTITLTVAGDAKINNSVKRTVRGGKRYESLNVFGEHRATISGGRVHCAYGKNTSTVNISGGHANYTWAEDASTTNIVSGTVKYANGKNTGTLNMSGGYVTWVRGDDASTVNISGGDATFTYGKNTATVNITGGTLGHAGAEGNSTVNISGASVVGRAAGDAHGTVNISGGSVTSVYGYETSTVNISGGSVTGSIMLAHPLTKVNFIGTALSFVHTGYGKDNAYDQYFDAFTVTGTVGGASKTYTVYVLNKSGTANPAQRGFHFVAPRNE